MILSLRNRLKILIYLGAGLLFVIALVDKGPGIAGLTINRLAVIEAALFLIMTIFDRWLWRYRVVVWALKSGPVVRGTWKTELRSSFNDQTYEAYIVFRQTYTHIDARLMTAESTSESTSCQLTAGPEGLAIIDYVYQNTTRPTVRDASPIHFGAARIECVGAWPRRMEGMYWTDRMTRGELVLAERSAGLAQTFDDARALFSGDK